MHQRAQARAGRAWPGAAVVGWAAGAAWELVVAWAAGAAWGQAVV
ncbi:MAG: hypothetical protein AB1503_11755 [Bacillota bacterium]